MDQVKLFKSCLSQILFGPFMNSLYLNTFNANQIAEKQIHAKYRAEKLERKYLKVFNGFNTYQIIRYLYFSLQVFGETRRFQSGDEDNFSQPRVFWKKTLNEKERSDLVDNIAGHLKDAQEFIRKRTVIITEFLFISNSFPANIYLFKVSNKSNRKRFEICSKLTIKKERCH